MGIALSMGMVLVAACTIDNTKRRYILAENLWENGKYSAAVAEFEQVYSRDPKGKLGLQALFRAAMTQNLFLAEYNDAIKKFRTYIDIGGEDVSAWSANKAIGEILFLKLNHYETALTHYQALLRKKPYAPEAPEFLYRIAKSQFFLWDFEKAIETYQEIISRYGGSNYAEKSAYELGVTYFTMGDRAQDGADAYQHAIDAYEAFLEKYPQSDLATFARFGIANCMEEQNLLEEALPRYEELLKEYPSTQVIETKLARLKQRVSMRNSRKTQKK
ncbi:MAG: tol-pal system YbgF family protein [Bacteriovoracia bacterium]